jgi:hypothetical protein
MVLEVLRDHDARAPTMLAFEELLGCRGAMFANRFELVEAAHFKPHVGSLDEYGLEALPESPLFRAIGKRFTATFCSSWTS